MALANSVWYVLLASSDRLPLQAIDKLCRVERLTDRIRAVMMVKRLTQRDVALQAETQPGRSLRGKSKAAQLWRDGITYSLEKILTWFLLCAQHSVLEAATAVKATGHLLLKSLRSEGMRTAHQ